MHDADQIVPRHVHCAVDHEAGRVDAEIGAIVNDIAIAIDLDQARGRNLVKQQAVRIDQELILVTRQARGDVGMDQVRPAVMCE
jgi:hypothetical protein